MYLYPFLAMLRPLTYMHLYFGSYIVKPKSWMLNLLPNQSSAIIKDLRLLFCVRHLLTERRLHLQVCPCDMLSSPMTLIYQFEILPFAIVLQFFTVGAMFNIARIAISCKKFAAKTWMQLETDIYKQFPAADTYTILKGSPMKRSNFVLCSPYLFWF